MGLSYREVAEILKIIDASQCEEVVLELEGIRLVVRRGASSGTGPDLRAPASATAQPRAATASPVATSPGPSAAAARSVPVRRAAAPDRLEIRAPMVGTFYRRPSPQDPPFVEAGRRVKKGDPLCLIEVMKLYTTIEAVADGVVEEIAAEDNALIEFDQLLFVIRPA